MIKNQESKEKICTFFASDYHFEMITLPYIEENLERNKEIVILTEDNLEETIQVLLSRVNLSMEKKDKILKINWSNNDLEKFKQIKENVELGKELIVFVKGKENYISNINNNINKWTNRNKNNKIIDCYDIEELGDKAKNVIERYTKILNTSGEKDIKI